MDIGRLIGHAELMDRDTLYDLRSVVALYPYWQTARLLMLQNLFLLHDPSFDDELRRAAVYIGDRRRLFDLVEAAHYRLTTTPSPAAPSSAAGQPQTDRTTSLIDRFLEQTPADDAPADRLRRPTPADATVDYVAYLLETEGDTTPAAAAGAAEGDRTTALIDSFMGAAGGRIELPRDQPSADAPAAAAAPAAPTPADHGDEEFFTETLARIYIQQRRYDRALAIIKRLDLNYPGKNAYFADQIRFLEKLIINSNTKPKV